MFICKITFKVVFCYERNYNEFMNKDIKEKYNDYLKYELNYSDYTIKEYFLHLDKYFEYINLNKINYLNIKKDDVMGYLKHLDDQKLSNKSITNILSSLRNFYDFLLDQKIVDNNIFRLIRNPKIEKSLPNFLSYEEMRLILDSIDDKDILDKRNKLIVELLYSTGIRVSELVNMKVSDINFTDKSIRVLGKGRKERIVYFGSYADEALKNYLDARNDKNEYLILNHKKEKITTRGIEKIIDKITLNCALNNNISPHTFRHTFATHLLNNGADIKSVQELLGHNSLNTTEIYTHITNDYLKSEYLKNMPR